MQRENSSRRERRFFSEQSANLSFVKHAVFMIFTTFIFVLTIYKFLK